MSESDKVEALFQWVEENDVLEDPELINKLNEEACRRWAHLTSTRRISVIVEKTLRKIK